jgi:hypothetical protein
MNNTVVETGQLERTAAEAGQLDRFAVERGQFHRIAVETMRQLLETEDVQALENPPSIRSDWHTVVVPVFGDTTWDVSLTLSEAAARRLTARMLGSDPVYVTRAVALDGAGELASVIACRCKDTIAAGTPMGVPQWRPESFVGEAKIAHYWLAWGDVALRLSTRGL